MFVGFSKSRSELEEDFGLSSLCTDEELRHKVGHHSHDACPVVHILFQFFIYYYLIFLLQNEILGKELSKKEQELKLHKAEFGFRCKGSSYFSFT